MEMREKWGDGRREEQERRAAGGHLCYWSLRVLAGEVKIKARGQRLAPQSRLDRHCCPLRCEWPACVCVTGGGGGGAGHLMGADTHRWVAGVAAVTHCIFQEYRHRAEGAWCVKHLLCLLAHETNYSDVSLCRIKHRRRTCWLQWDTWNRCCNCARNCFKEKDGPPRLHPCDSAEVKTAAANSFGLKFILIDVCFRVGNMLFTQVWRYG